MEIKKIKNCDYVMFPRLQEQGVEFQHVEREAFHAELRHVEGLVTTGSSISRPSHT